MPRNPDPELLLWWRDLLQRHDPQQQSVGQFCRDNEISVSSFYKWRKRVRQSDHNRLIPVEIVQPPRVEEQTPVARIRFGRSIDIELNHHDARLIAEVAACLNDVNSKQESVS